jgi:hypothetical protein
MTGPEPSSSRFRRNLIRVLSVEVVTLLALWLFQRHFTH